MGCEAHLASVTNHPHNSLYNLSLLKFERPHYSELGSHVLIELYILLLYFGRLPKWMSGPIHLPIRTVRLLARPGVKDLVPP